MAQKKLLYIVRYPLDEPFNLKAKFDGQLAAFRDLGFDVYHLGFDRQHFYLLHDGSRQIIGKTHFGIPGYFHTLCYHDMYRLARKQLKRLGIDCVYWRAAPHLPESLRLAKAVGKAGARLIYEYPTYPANTEKSMSLLRKLYSAYADRLGKQVDDLADGFVLIGADAGGSYNGKPAVNISNGIDLSVIPQRTYRPDPEAVHILALASMSYWHGYDRLIRSLAAYEGSQKVVLHMVGGNDGGMLPEWQKLTQALGLEDSVLFHGPKSGDGLGEMFDLCDIGVNSLGMYRKGFSVTSELKTREYAARGLPFVCSVEDPALQHTDAPLWLRISNDESIPDMAAIVSFALQMRSDEAAPAKLRQYAATHLTWQSQYRTVFEKIEI